MNLMPKIFPQNILLRLFQECRISGRLPPLRLDGFLLRPVQHLCRYPLLLGELLRLTPRLHPDYSHCSAALQCMQNLLSSINSKRRNLEEMVELVRWQRSIFGWHVSVATNDAQMTASDLQVTDQ